MLILNEVLKRNFTMKLFGFIWYSSSNVRKPLTKFDFFKYFAIFFLLPAQILIHRLVFEYFVC